MIWADKISDILALVNASSVYNTARNTTPSNLGLAVVNLAKDWLCMYKPWRDLATLVQIPLDTTRKCILPSDFGCIIEVFTDPSNIGKPMWSYTLRDNDVAKRYDEETIYDKTTGWTRKLVFPPTVYIPQDPWVRYSKVIADYAGIGTEYSFFPAGIMILTSKKILQDFYGIPANDDPNWIRTRIQEELRMLESYAYKNNLALDMAIKDQFGNPLRIPGASLDGSQQRLTTPSPFLPSTFYSGGTL